MMQNSSADACELCQRRVPLTFHHLIPKKVHRRPRFKKSYSKQELAQGIQICSLCHRGLHSLYDEMALARQFFSLDLIREDPAISRHIAWVAKQKAGLAHDRDGDGAIN